MSNIKTTFVGQFVSNEDHFEGFSRAGNNYQKKVIKFLKPKNCISIFPYFFEIKDCKSLNNNFFYSNKKLNTHGFYFIKALVWGFKKGILINSGNILYYNFTPYYLGFYLASFIRRKKQFFIIADYWQKNSYMQSIQNYVVSNSQGVLALNKNIKINKNSKYLYGLIDSDEIAIYEIKSNDKLKFLFSGSIGYETGFDLCLEFFKNYPDYELYITGFLFGEIKNSWQSYLNIINESPNINYLGPLNKYDYQKLLNNVDVCFSLRNPDDDQHKYNFPSKILEYLSKGKIVISSLNYKNLKSPLFYKTGFSTESIKTVIDDISHSNFLNDEKQLNNNQTQLLKDFGKVKFNLIIRDLMK